MLRSVHGGAVLILLNCCGCLFQHGGFIPPPRHPTQGKAVEVQTFDIATQLQPVTADVQTDGTHGKRIAVYYRGSDPLHKFEVYLAENSKGHMEDSTATFILDYGLAYACGYMPRVRHDGPPVVTAGADGSCVAVWIQNAPNPEYHVYYLEGNYAFVDFDNPPK